MFVTSLKSLSFRHLKSALAISKNVCIERHVYRALGRRNFHRCFQMNKSDETELSKYLKTRILSGGPITVAEYMKEVLTNPVSGYYMHKDVFGSDGDFITSPEISQMFGELLAVWCVNEWIQCDSPPSLQVVELGPGRGTLAEDMLRVFSQFKEIKDVVSLNLVEVSPKLSEIQQKRLSGMSDSQNSTRPDDKSYRQCYSKYGPPVRWYHGLQDVPKGFSFFLAHEFLDALPIHVFQKKNNTWHELFIDVDDTSSGDHHLRFVLSRNPTTASQILLKVASDDQREHIELCPQAGVVVEEITKRIAEDGGYALLADYGHSGEKSDTFRAFKSHKLHHPLCEPGTADLTADVDFSYLKNITGGKVAVTGPITQAEFLHNMGIGVRLQVLMGKASTEQRKDLSSGYDMLTNPDKMGERFKFLAIRQHSKQEYTPAGFQAL